jgi:hypothetical protein
LQHSYTPPSSLVGMGLTHTPPIEPGWDGVANAHTVATLCYLLQEPFNLTLLNIAASALRPSNAAAPAALAALLTGAAAGALSMHTTL